MEVHFHIHVIKHNKKKEISGCFIQQFNMKLVNKSDGAGEA